MPRRAAGFTLLEILVVLVIIASMAGLLVVAIPDSPAQKLRREAVELATLINAASDEAVLRGVELGLVVDDKGYQFVYFDPETRQWQSSKERALARHDFAGKYTVEFAIDGARVDETTRQRMQALADRSEDAERRPALLILSSGEVTPFSLTFSAEAVEPVVIIGDGLNPVVLAEPDTQRVPG